MHVAMATVLHRVYTFQRPPETHWKVTAVILGILVPFLIYHCVADEFTMHVILFISMTVVVTTRTRNIIKERVKERSHRKRMTTLATFGSSTAAFAYFLWNIDVHLCPTVTRVKRQVGLPWGFLLELHGWWHLLTAVAAYTFMALVEFLTDADTDEGRGVGFAWPAGAVLEKIGPGPVGVCVGLAGDQNGAGEVAAKKDR
jgi:dihydroceramidase